MKRNLLLTTTLLLVFFLKIQANTFTFTGVGNWNDSTKWTPYFPKNTPLQSYTSVQDSVVINGICTIQNTDLIEISYSITYLVNGTLINNGEMNFLGHFYVTSNGDFINNNIMTGLMSYGTDEITWKNTLVNYGNFSNQGSIMIDGLESCTIENYGNLTNHNYIESGADVKNYGKIISIGGNISSFGRQFFNYDTIIGNLKTGSLINYGFISPGFFEFDTDTMHYGAYGLGNFGQAYLEINSASDYDVIVFDYANDLSEMTGLVVNFNPNYTPSVNDTFKLVYALNENSNLFKLSRNSMTLPTPPLGYNWHIINEPLAMKLTLIPLTALPYESLTFKAMQKGTQVDLNWNVTSIENVALFEIERTDENNHFEKIGSVNGSKELAYSFIDSKPKNGINQYRLKAIDVDGKYQYSFIISITFSILKNEIINTLVENNLFINLENEATLFIYNSIGDCVSTLLINKGQTTVSLSHLSKGNYFVKTANGIYKILKL